MEIMTIHDGVWISDLISLGDWEWCQKEYFFFDILHLGLIKTTVL